MLSLNLLGGLSLGSPEGKVPLRASQRRRLALLAILAVSRRPVGRAKLVSLLWPDAETDHARHLLADSIYVLRGDLGEGAVLTTGENVSLSSAHVSSDVGEFIDALEARDYVRAVSIYSSGGAFLDGVHIAGSSEFERWTDTTSRQLEASYRRALEELAKAATSRGDHREATTWWRRLAQDDRASSRVALELMRALEASGDTAGAVEFAAIHEKIVRAELDTPPDPSVTAFANDLRSRRAPQLAATNRSSIDVKSAVRADSTEFEHASATASNQRERSRNRWVWGLTTIIIGATVYSLLAMSTRENVAESNGDARFSLAVIPFRSITPGSDNESFADALTEEIIASLSRIDRLRVIGSTSTFAFKGTSVDLRTINNKLRVSNLLEGGVQRSGSRIRLSVRLIDARDGSSRWSEVYDRDLKDLFGVEDEIGRSVAGQLNLLADGKSLPRHRNRTTSTQAYDSYLRGRHQRELRSDSGFKAAIGYFSNAVTADSTYAAAYAGLAEACASLAFNANKAELSRSKLLQCSENASRRALQLDDSLPEAHLALGFLRLGNHIDLSVAERELKRALELDPGNRQAHEDMAIVFGATGRCDLALGEAREAEDVDPLSVTAIREVGRALYCARRYDDALIELNRARSMGPTVRNIPLIIAQVYAKKGMVQEGIAELQRGPAHSFARALLGHMFGLAGNSREASRILSELRSQYESGVGSAFSVAVVYAGVRDYDNAFRWLDMSFDDSSIRANIMDPLFDDLRADPRFMAVRARMGLKRTAPAKPFPTANERQ